MGAMLVRHEPTSASAVRRELAQDLVLHGLDEDSVDAVTLVTSELLGNAIRHSGISDDAELDVAWTIGRDEVMVTVEDPSPEPPMPRTAAPEEPSGRGLTIIEALTLAWGYDPTPTGKRVWARVRVSGSAA